jgi:ribosomal subunit interface protein
MNIHISSQNVDIETKEMIHIESKIKKLERFFKADDTSAQASILVIKTTNHHHKGDIYKTEIRLHTSGKEHYCESTTSSVSKSFDLAFKSIEKEIKTHYGKKNALFKRGAKKIKEILRYQK